MNMWQVCGFFCCATIRNMSIDPDKQHEIEFEGSSDVIPAKGGESPLRKALREQFSDMGITASELDKMEARIRAEGNEHLYVKKEERPASTPEQREQELQVQEHRKKFELAERARESLRKVPEEQALKKPFTPSTEESRGKEMGLSPNEERKFADWVTQKLNAGLEIPNDAEERLQQFRNEELERQNVA